MCVCVCVLRAHTSIYCMYVAGEGQRVKSECVDSSVSSLWLLCSAYQSVLQHTYSQLSGRDQGRKTHPHLSLSYTDIMTLQWNPSIPDL